METNTIILLIILKILTAIFLVTCAIKIIYRKESKKESEAERIKINEDRSSY